MTEPDAVWLPLHEFDPSPESIIHPSIHKPMLGFPERAVMCWFGDVVAERTAHCDVLYHLPFEHGDHPVCVIDHDGVEVAPACALAGEARLAVGHRRRGTPCEHRDEAENRDGDERLDERESTHACARMDRRCRCAHR